MALRRSEQGLSVSWHPGLQVCIFLRLCVIFFIGKNSALKNVY